MKNKLFDYISNITAKHPWRVLILGFVITLILGFFSSKLRLELTWLGLVPKNEPVALNFERILKEFGNEGGLVVVVEHENIDSLISIGKEIKKELEKLKKIGYVKALTFEQDEDFIRKHAFMLLDSSVLSASERLFSSANIDSFLFNLNENFEKEYIEKEENLESYEIESVSSLMALEDFLYGIKNFLKDKEKTLLKIGIREMVLGPIIFRSLDGKMALISIVPSMSALI